LVTLLKSEKDIEVVAEAADGKETCELYNELAPDVLLLDLRMPEKDGLQVITELMSHGEPKPRIIVMTTYESEGDVRRALKAGAKGYLVKGADPQQIREAVRKVAAGRALLQPEIASKLAESMARPERSCQERCFCILIVDQMRGPNGLPFNCKSLRFTCNLLCNKIVASEGEEPIFALRFTCNRHWFTMRTPA
jgi:DNA-binding NarL/FixJ family response regulator